jgi:CAAX protease family protein
MPIARAIGTSGGAKVVVALIAATLIISDLWLVWRGNVSYLGPRSILPMVAVAAYLLMARGDLASLGLRPRPVQGLRYWIVATLASATAIGAILAVGGLVFVLTGRPLPIYATGPHDILEAFVRMCILAPLVEEATYRLGFCTGAVPLLGPRLTIAASGLTFGALHVLYGNAGPNNLVAGFFLAWSYLKSESFLIPVALHSLGNLLVLLVQVAAWYWLTHS